MRLLLRTMIFAADPSWLMQTVAFTAVDAPAPAGE